jgi:hypothetical protein
MLYGVQEMLPYDVTSGLLVKIPRAFRPKLREFKTHQEEPSHG